MPQRARGGQRRRPHHVVVAAYDGVQSLDVTGPYEVFAGANAVLDHADRGAARYSLAIVSIDGGLVTSESGLQLMTSVARRTPIDTLVIPGGTGALTACTDVRIVAMIAALAGRAGRVASVCTGAFIAAAAGLADGCTVTTHWARAGELRRRFPRVTVDADPIYIRDGDLWSSAGVTAGIDLALALVEEDHSADVAQVVARWLVMFLRRPGGQTQFAAPVWAERAVTPPVRAAQELIDAAPGEDHRVDALSARVGMSTRHFIRCFTAETGTSPARYVAEVRIEAARRALETTGDTVDAIARRCGFGTAETMRRTFGRRLGTSPDQYRQRFRHHPAVPTEPTIEPTIDRSPT